MMDPKLQSAIMEFLANEFHIDTQNMSPDMSFSADFHQSPDQLSLLLQHMQDALNFTIPEDKADQIETINDLFSAIIQMEEGSNYESTD